MARIALTDEIWGKLEAQLRMHGCHRWKNDYGDPIFLDQLFE